jgi:SAM-dependent methyltransferase
MPPNDSGLHVQYGCGLCAPPTWRNFDASLTLRLQRLPVVGRAFRRPPYPPFPPNVEYGDIVRGLPVAEGSCAGVYCSHVLEHLALADFRVALANTRAMLRPGGVFRLVVPDLEPMARAYLASDEPNAALAFIANTHMGVSARAHGVIGRLRRVFGTGAHLWMWDHRSMESELRRAGFRDVRRARFGDASDPAFADVEAADRWADSVGMEAVR